MLAECGQVDRQIAFSSAEVALEIGLPLSPRSVVRADHKGWFRAGRNEPRAKARPPIIGASELHGLVACIWSGNTRKTKWCSCWESRGYDLAADSSPTGRDTFLTKPADSSNSPNSFLDPVLPRSIDRFLRKWRYLRGGGGRILSLFQWFIWRRDTQSNKWKVFDLYKSKNFLYFWYDIYSIPIDISNIYMLSWFFQGLSLTSRNVIFLER